MCIRIEYPDLVTGENSFDFSKSNTVTLIFLGDQIAALVNGEIAYTALDPPGTPLISIMVSRQITRSDANTTISRSGTYEALILPP